MGAANIRRRREGAAARTLVMGLVVIGAAIVIVAAALTAPNGLPVLSYRTLTAKLPSVANLQVHNDVRIAGTRVGQVIQVDSAPDGSAMIKLKLSPGTGALPADTRARSRSAGLLGQRYLELIPGRSRTMLADNAVFAPPQGAATLGVAEALQTFDTETRGGLEQSVDGLGTGLLGRSRDLNDTLALAAPAAADFTTMADAVTSDPAAARALVPSLDRAAAALDPAAPTFGRAFASTAQALQPFVSRRSDTRATLEALPPALTRLSPALRAGRRLLGSVRAVAAAADHTLPPAPAAIDRATELLRVSPRPLRVADRLLGRARTAVPAAVELLQAVKPALGPVRHALDTADQPLGVLARHGCDIVNFARNWRSFLSFGIPNDARIGPLGEIRAEAIVTQPYAAGGTALQLPAQLERRDLYPAPCSLPSTRYDLLNPLGR